MKLILGRKIRMSQFHDADGQVVPVTVVKAGDSVVTQIKTVAKDGYAAVQFGFNEGSKHPSRALIGHVKGLLARPKLCEMRLDDASAFTVGEKYDITIFVPGDVVAVTGTSKGRGFAGVVKRHHFHGSPKTHGHKHDHRAPGSIGATAAQRVFPGMRMGGRMGGEQVTITNLKIAAIDKEKGEIMIKGAVPGARNGFVIISGIGDMKAAA
ncbi:MAG: 50S ribosomal protein L3 [Candidatus Komeilibacteria bacterium]|nr:50S ribosomal protein L3 [Candidatus Komeilibacteria bacterium]